MSQAVRNHVKEKLARDEVVASMVVRMVATPSIATLAAGCGFDSLYVDLEHGPQSIETTSAICVAAIAAGVTPFVRVPHIGTEYVSRVIDGGALGVIAPHVETPEAAAAVVRMAKFPPLGQRSDPGPMPQFRYQNPAPGETHGIMNEATSVVIMVESGATLDRLDEIAAVEGVDMLFIGSNDLCSDFGIPGAFDDPRLTDAFARTIDAARKHGKHVGVGGLGGRPDLVARMVGMGARYVSIGADLTFLASAGKAAATLVHELATNP